MIRLRLGEIEWNSDWHLRKDNGQRDAYGDSDAFEKRL